MLRSEQQIDWKYALGLELSDAGFHYSVVSEFRQRLIAGGAERLLLEKLLERCEARVRIPILVPFKSRMLY